MVSKGCIFKEMLALNEDYPDVINMKSHLKKVTFSAGTEARLSVFDVHELLKCPICANVMRPPIIQCPNGHTLCTKCKHRVQNSCPTCNHELKNIRCLALERVAQSLELPCRYQSLGCREILSCYLKISHECCCNFRPYNCPHNGSGCSFSGGVPTLIAHLEDDHRVDTYVGSSFNHRYVESNPLDAENATWMLAVFSCFGKYFCLRFEAYLLGATPVYMASMRFIGEADEAKEFSYRLEVGGGGRKMIWEGVPRSIRDCHRRVRDSMDGLIISRHMALFFSGGEHKELKLQVTGRIWRML